ncbi:MAG: YbaK/EbsC family protein [Spirochaetes bacterium]|uniref:YbaK/EbsC family protein n=1 Tax=Candidatus Ornithospirochaeta stercoripullorum TaxID=2840899 RepID=A0A9D9E0C0_9SPIO|nr:YbaK/EbsC family protein [Candidatus Ornithospirochaeta stercoripullorum]
MSLEKAREHLAKYGKDQDIILFEQSSATVREAAADLNTEEGRIAKTMSFILSSGPIVIVAAGDRKIDNRKFKDTFQEKAKMIGPEEVESLTGHPVGGVCPFGVNAGVRVYLDESLKRFDYVYPAAGTPNSAIKLTIKELETTSEYTSWIDVTKLPIQQD